MADSMTRRGWVGKAHHFKSTAGTWLHQAQVRLVQLSIREDKYSLASHPMTLEESCGIRSYYTPQHKWGLLPALAQQLPTLSIPGEEMKGGNVLHVPCPIP